MDKLLASWGDKVVSAGAHKGRRFRDIQPEALRRVTRRCPDPELFRFARLAAAAEALQDVRPCRPLPGPAAVVAAPSRLGWERARQWMQVCGTALSGPRLGLVLLLAILLSRPQTHLLLTRFLTGLAKQLVRYVLSVLVHVIEVCLEELRLLFHLQGRASPPTLLETECPAHYGLGLFGQLVLSSTSVCVGAMVAWLGNSPLRARMRLV